MPSSDSIHQLLRLAAQILDQAATQIRDAKLAPVSDNVKSIGRALSEIFAIEEHIYQQRPDLMPSHLKASSPNPEANQRLARFMVEAATLEETGEIANAIAKYEEFLSLEESAHHRSIAESEIKRLSKMRLN